MGVSLLPARLRRKVQTTRQSAKPPQRSSWDASFGAGAEGGSTCKRAEAQVSISESFEGQRSSEQDLKQVSSLWRQPKD